MRNTLVTLRLRYVFYERQILGGEWFFLVLVAWAYSKFQGYRESFPKYLRQILVFMWNNALREKFNFSFSRDFW